MAFHLIFVVIGTTLWILLFNLNLTLTTNIITILATLVIIFLGLLFMIQLNYFLGMLAFKFQDVSFFLMVKGNIVTFVTGGLVPLALLPNSIIKIMKFLPFYYVTYLPSMLLIGKSKSEIIHGIAILSMWLLLFLIINKFSYNKMRVIYDGVGI